MMIPSSLFDVHSKKFKKFNGLNYKWRKYKILIYVPILSLVKFLLQKVLKLSNNEFDFIIIVALDVWNHNDFIGKKLHLNRLNNT